MLKLVSNKRPSKLKTAILPLAFAFVILFAGTCAAQDKEDRSLRVKKIMDIPFGISETDARTILNKEKDSLEKSGISPEFNLFPNFFIINNYPFKDKPITVCLYFDYGSAYYTFRVKSEMLPEASVDTEVYKDADLFNQLFEERFGKPARCFPRPEPSKIDYRYDTRYCEWENQAFEIFTGFSRREEVFYGYGVVTDKALFEALKKYEKDNNIEKPPACSGYYD